jgi:hypothetical protein
MARLEELDEPRHRVRVDDRTDRRVGVVGEVDRVDDRRPVEPGEEDHLRELLEVTEAHVQRGEDHRHASGERGEEHESDQDRRQIGQEVAPLPEEERRGSEQREAEVERLREHERQRDDLAGEVHLPDERAVADDRAHRGVHAVREELPDEVAGQEEAREAVDGDPQERREDHGEDRGHEQRGQQRPDDPQERVLVADLDLFANEVPQQLSGLLKVAQARRQSGHGGEV